MKLYDVKPLFEAAGLAPNSFPIMSANLEGGSKTRFEKTLADFKQFLADGELIKSEFATLKDMNRRIEEVVTKTIAAPYWHGGKYEQLPEHLQYDLDYSNIALHTIPGKLKKAEALQKKGDHPVLHAYIDLMKELLPLHTAQKELKGMIVAKKAAVVQKAEAKEKYTANIMAHEDVVRVKKVLTEITNDLRDRVLSSNYGYLVDVVNRHMDQYDPEDRETSNYGRNKRNPFVRAIINKAVEQEHRKPETLKDNWKELLQAEAKKMTDDILSQFINKQTSKLAEILVKKDNLKSVRLENARTGSGIIEGLLELDFEDGSSFEVNNKIVWAISKLGKQFYRFPTTFHNVKMPDGKTLSGKASEQRMKEEFAA